MNLSYANGWAGGVLVCISLATEGVEPLFTCFSGHLYLLFGSVSLNVLFILLLFFLCLVIELLEFIIY